MKINTQKHLLILMENYFSSMTLLDYGLSIVGYSDKGLIPVISTKLPFLDASSSLDTFLYRFSTPLGLILSLGDQYYTGLYGPYPVPNHRCFHAYTYSFFVRDTILGTPRDDLNAFVIMILFFDKKYIVDMPYIEDYLNNYVATLKDLNALLSKINFELLVSSLHDIIIEQEIKVITKEAKGSDEIIVQNDQYIHPNSFPVKDTDAFDKNNNVFIELKTEPESIVAVPWILHAVYHGLEQATYDILGESSSLLEILMEQYTGEILDRFHLFDAIFEKNDPTVVDALELGVKHLERVGEYVNVKPLGENKFECTINCSFADAVHPYLPINKCLWMRYLTAMVRRTLPPDKELHMDISEFDSEFDSKAIIEIVPKVFKTI